MLRVRDKAGSREAVQIKKKKKYMNRHVALFVDLISADD